METDAAPRWWQTRWFAGAMVALACVPLLWPAIPPLVDLPGHMGRYRVQLELGEHPWLAGWYAFRWQLIGNLGIDLLIEPLAPLLGLEHAVKLLVIAIPALTVAGLLWIAREVHGRVPATALFALPLAYGYPLQFGFVNFALSMAIALCLFAWWLRLARQGRFRFRAAVFVPVSCLLWVCHTYGWGFLGVLAFSAEMIRQHDLRRGNGALHWAEAWFRAGLNCLPLALPVLLMALWRTSDDASGFTGDWFNWQAKVDWVLMILRDRWIAFDIGSTAVLYVVLLLGFRDPKLEYSRHLGLSAVFLLAVFLLLPRIVFGSAYADMRLAPFMVAIAVIAVRPRTGIGQRRAALVAGLALAFVAVRTTATTISFARFGERYDRELAALDHLPVGAKLVTFVGETCHNQWKMSRLEHMPALALERRLAYTNDQWSMAGAQLMTVRYFPARRYAHDPSQIVTAVQCPREYWRPIARSLAKFPRDAFDYVWTIGVPPYDPRLEQGLVPLWRRGSSALFRVDHAVPAPELPEDIVPPPPSNAAG